MIASCPMCFIVFAGKTTCPNCWGVKGQPALVPIPLLNELPELKRLLEQVAAYAPQPTKEVPVAPSE